MPKADSKNHSTIFLPWPPSETQQQRNYMLQLFTRLHGTARLSRTFRAANSEWQVHASTEFSLMRFWSNQKLDNEAPVVKGVLRHVQGWQSNYHGGRCYVQDRWMRTTQGQSSSTSFRQRRWKDMGHKSRIPLLGSWLSAWQCWNDLFNKSPACGSNGGNTATTDACHRASWT